MERGKYIVIEGGDGTGKSTLAIMLAKKLESLGIKNLLVHNDETGQLEPIQEPGGTPKADALRRKIKDKSISRTPWENVEWFTKARQSSWNEAIEPALARGEWVVASRSWISTMAYQGYGEGIDTVKIEAYTKKEVGEQYMHPDFACILTLADEATRRARITNRGATSGDTFESKPKEFQQSMQDGYLQFAKDFHVTTIDASRTLEEVFDDIWSHIAPLT